MGGAGGDHVAVEARDFAILEEYGELALLALGARLLAPVDVIPAVGVEDVGEQRRAQDRAHLLLAHAGLQLPDHFLRHEIALLDVDAVRRYARNPRYIAAAAEEREAHQEKRATHPHIMTADEH